MKDQQAADRKALPPASKVEDAKEEPGTAKRCADQQVGENRMYLNKCEESKNTGE